ncbi:hypothetical protein [Flavobacterium caeni]|uniref:Uncharacterized protein n=1 Tax=Flavobacterium caeni TaxID=490189 RepID=A0A1G5KKW1_9FLAO|nr:hypothetical protein [Flavobacterium caeni]SCZ01004.1 hypothetical protein SAMN02927903_03352 [Flavobacterium caeni]
MNTLKPKNNLNLAILKFILKIWVLTSFVGAIFFKPIGMFFSKNNDSLNLYWSVVLIFFAFGLLFSIPAMIILAVVIKKFEMKILTITLIAIALVFISFLAVGLSKINSPRTLIYPTIYSFIISVIILISYRKLRNRIIYK